MNHQIINKYNKLFNEVIDYYKLREYVFPHTIKIFNVEQTIHILNLQFDFYSAGHTNYKFSKDIIDKDLLVTYINDGVREYLSKQHVHLIPFYEFIAYIFHSNSINIGDKDSLEEILFNINETINIIRGIIRVELKLDNIMKRTGIKFP